MLLKDDSSSEICDFEEQVGRVPFGIAGSGPSANDVRWEILPYI
jgi:hypothetical protein